MTPKSLLRAKQASSALDEFTEGGFQVVIGEAVALDDAAVRRVVACSGKVYFDLLNARQERGINDIALIRVEQLYPFPRDEFGVELARYPKATELVWAQEEPQNQGAWYAIGHHLRDCMPATLSLKYAGRPFSASPAVGYPEVFEAQRQALIDEALNYAD
jgi:2-oxoglutarate dehydrogenase E1 component